MRIVESWPEIVDNLRQFSYVTEGMNTDVNKRLSQFFHWYYFPKSDSFVPSKFLGYHNMTVGGYRGAGSGGTTQKALAPFFIKLPKESKQFTSLFAKLENYLASLDKHVSAKVTAGTGGIYVPRPDYADIGDEYPQELFNQVSDDIASADDESEDSSATEGGKKTRLTSYYERDPKLRTKAVNYHGTKCMVCKFDFHATYGAHGLNFIEVHHIKPLHSLDGESEIDYRTDMAVLCANCHRMIHRKRDSPLSVKELIKLHDKYRKS